jgi:hypothetical protein
MSSISPNEIGTIYGELYDALEAVDSPTLEKFAADRQMQSLREETADRVRATGVLPADLRTGLTQRTAYAALTALHDVLAEVPRSDAAHLPPALLPVWRRWIDSGSLGGAALAGAILARTTLPGRVQEAADTLEGHTPALLRVGADDWARCRLLMPSTHAVTAAALVEPIRVAAVPYFGSRSDVKFRLRNEATKNWYTVGPSRRFDRAGRVEAALAALDKSNAVVGLVPELTLDSTTVRLWKAAITAAGDRETRLRWLLIGSGPVSTAATTRVAHAPAHQRRVTSDGGPKPKPNRAVLLDRITGEVVLTQDKQRGFTFGKRQIGQWGLRSELGDGPVAEYFARGSVLSLLETSAGRLCVLICEDLGRTIEIGATAGRLGVHLVLAPILAPLIAPDGGWAASAAIELAAEVGTRTVVANSAAITRTTREGDPAVTLMTVTPGIQPVDDWGSHLVRCGEPAAATAQLAPADDAVTARVSTV